MKARKFVPAFLLFFVIALGFCLADYLKVNRKAQIFKTPSKDSKVIFTAEVGAELQLLKEEPTNRNSGYYKVINSSSGQIGWIYKTFGRRYKGSAEPIPAGEPVSMQPKASAEAEQLNRHLKIGKPVALYERLREGYVLAQDARLKIPCWVQYELSPEDLRDGIQRKDAFKADTSIPSGSRAELSDYRNSGYDKGHLAPAADMGRSEKVMNESFLLSNMAPQVGVGFNQGIWKDLEDAVRGWVEQKGVLTIISGPVFYISNNKVTYPVIGKDCVAVPTHFFKIVVDAKNPNSVDTLAFLLPNKDLNGHDYSECLVSIDEIEQMTGLDFLSALPQDIQDKVESSKAIKVW